RDPVAQPPVLRERLLRRAEHLRQVRRRCHQPGGRQRPAAAAGGSELRLPRSGDRNPPVEVACTIFVWCASSPTGCATGFAAAASWPSWAAPWIAPRSWIPSVGG